jgi:hypothetical protein
MAVCDVVVIGSYPPMPGPATAATLAAVRRAWDGGFSVRVVSFRTGAADIAVPVAGPLAGWRLEQIRRHYGDPAHVVLVVQAGVPFFDLRPLHQVATAQGLALGLRRFKRATLVVGEDPALLWPCFRTIARSVDECIVASDESALALARRYRLPIGSITVREVDPFPAFPTGDEALTGGLYRPGGAGGLTVVELPTTTLAQRARARARLSRSMLPRRLRGR